MVEILVFTVFSLKSLFRVVESIWNHDRDDGGGDRTHGLDVRDVPSWEWLRSGHQENRERQYGEKKDREIDHAHW